MKTLAFIIFAVGSYWNGWAQSGITPIEDIIKYDTIVAKNTGEAFIVRTLRDRKGKIRAVSYGNIRDKYTDENYYYLDGRVYEEDIADVPPATLGVYNIHNAIKSSFTEAELRKLTDVNAKLIFLPTVSNTGKVLEVYCRIEYDRYVDIPIERIATLQKKIKALRGTVTDPVAKQLKYTSSFNMIFFKNL